MSFDQLRKAVKSKLAVRHMFWLHGRAKALFAISPINVTIGKVKAIGWFVVVEHAFCDMKNLVFLDSLSR